MSDHLSGPTWTSLSDTRRSPRRRAPWPGPSGRPALQRADQPTAQLALAIGAQADGAVRFNVRKALDHVVPPEEICLVAL